MTAGIGLTEQVFKEAERLHPDLMEPYSSRLGDELDAAERQHIMRKGLAETFRRRHPMPASCWSTPCTPQEIAAWDAHVAMAQERAQHAAERFRGGNT